jgi:hypothetical protein
MLTSGFKIPSLKKRIKKESNTMWDTTTSRDDAHRPKWWDAPLVAKQEYSKWFLIVYLVPIIAVIGLLLWLFVY